MQESTTQLAYRYYTQRYSIIVDAEREEFATSDPKLVLMDYPIIKHTKCGFWIDEHGKNKFVRIGAKRQYAHLTKFEALRSLVARKKSYVSHSHKRLQLAKEELSAAERVLKCLQT